MSPNEGEGGWGCGVLANEYSCTVYTGDQINFGNLTPYLTYTLKRNETHTHISKTEFVTSFLDLNMSDFDLYIL